MALTSECLADVSAQLQRAAEYKDSGCYNQADELYNKIVSENPGTDNALKAQKELVLLSLKTKYDVQSNANEQTALDKLTADFAANPNLPAALYEIAVQYGKDRKYEKAKSLYQRIIQQYPSSPYAIKSQMDIPKTDIMELVVSKRDSAAKTAIEKFISDYSQSSYIAEALHDIAYQWRWSKNFEEAIKTYQYVVDHWPTNEYGMWSQMGVAKSNVEAGNYDAAKPALDKLVQNYAGHPGLAEALERIALQYRKAGKFAEAKGLYQKIVQTDPNGVFGGRGRVKISEMDVLSTIVYGNDAAAETAINSFIVNFAGDAAVPAALTDIAWEYEKAGKYQQAKNVYQKIIECYPDNFRAGKAFIEITKGQILELIKAGQDDKISSEVDKLVAAYPNHAFLPDALCQIADGYYNKATQDSKQPNDYFCKAEAIYQKVIDTLPASRNFVPRACCRTGDCYRELREYEKSINYYHKVINDYPTYGMAWSVLFEVGHNYQRMGESGVISKSEANVKTKAAYEQLLAKYPDCKAATAAQNWLLQQVSSK